MNGVRSFVFMSVHAFSPGTALFMNYYCS
jgi:hypothetical protein